MRRSLAHAMMFGAPKATGFQGRNRPRVHKLLIGIASLKPVALGIMDIFRKHGGRAVKLESGILPPVLERLADHVGAPRPTPLRQVAGLDDGRTCSAEND